MPESLSEQAEFTGWRAYLWPVHSYELKKLIPMLLIFFLITLDYNILRNLKDTLVVTAKASGAEVIPFIKVWVMFPGALLMTFLFTRLSNRMRREVVFYVMIATFLIYFFFFTFVLYPARHYLHPHETADALQAMLPVGFKGLVAMVRNWTFTSFYVMAELWSNIIVAMLFWGFANQVTKIHEAKRFYGLFGMGANLSGVAAGQAAVMLSSNSFNPSLPFGEDAWGQTLVLLTGVILISGILIVIIFRWMHTNVLNQPLFSSSSTSNETTEPAEEEIGKLSMRDSFAYLIRSKYLLSIAVIVVAYNLVINLVEVMWKHEVRALYPAPLDYNVYMNQVTIVTGILATLAAMLISGNSIRRFGWTFTAMLTPTILFITSLGFFGFFFLKPYLASDALPYIGASTLAIVVFFGSAQNIMSRAAKYSVFDATKEMAFVPLSATSKLKGKAVIDGVGSRLGKSGGSVIHQTLLITFSTITASAPYVAGFLLAMILLWMLATRVLGKQFTALTAPPQRTPKAEPVVVRVNEPDMLQDPQRT